MSTMFRMTGIVTEWGVLLTILLLSLIILRYLHWWIYNPLRHIPGPRFSLPIFGNLYLLGTKTHLALSKLQQVYGDIYRLQLGPHAAVVISGKDAIKTACSMTALSGRPHKLFNSWRKHERYFAFGHSQACIQYRKATMKAVGLFTKNQLADIVREAADSLIQMLCSSRGGRSQTSLIRSHVADVSYFMCFGEKRKSRNDTEFQEVMSSLQSILSFAKQAGMADMFPWALYIPSVKKSYELFVKAQNDLIKLVKKQEKRHGLNRTDRHDADRGSIGGADDLCDLLQDSMSSQQLQELAADDTTLGTLSEQTGMLLVAGYETVAVTLLWVILLLASHTETQEKIHSQLQGSADSKSELLDAFIFETLRFSMASPLAMPHMTTSNLPLNGLTIPPNTLVLINLWSGSRDSRIWGEQPHTFDPYRFLNSAGEVDTSKVDHLVAFGSGRRRCVGEQLAKVEITQFAREIITKCQIALANPEQEVEYWPDNDNGRNIPPAVDLVFTGRISLDT